MMTKLLKEENNTHETTPVPTGTGNSQTFSRESFPQDTLADLFPDRDLSVAQDPKRRDAAPRSFNAQQTRHLNRDVGEQGGDSKEGTDQETTQESPKEKPVELHRLQEELEKTQKRLTENQQYGRQNAQRLKTTAKLVKELENEGSLNEEETARLLESLEKGLEEDLETESSPFFNNPFGAVLAIANQELENIRKYTGDSGVDDKVRAFDYFLMVASREEREEALEELMDLKDSPLKLAKSMLERGQVYEKSYKEMTSVGSLHGLLTHKDQEITKLTKTIDKLTKKLSQYEDYDPPRHRLDEMGESDERGPSRDTIGSLFDDRDRIKRR